MNTISLERAERITWDDNNLFPFGTTLTFIAPYTDHSLNLFALIVASSNHHTRRTSQTAELQRERAGPNLSAEPTKLTV